MELRLLGPVELYAGGRALAAGPPQRCGVLAALAVDAGRSVPVTVLMDRVWGPEPPQRARRTLHTHLTRIRRLLEQTADAESEPVPIVHRGGGYALDIDPARVDIHRFRELVERARLSDCPSRERVSLLRESRALWRGEPLAGLPGEWAAHMRYALLREHLDAAVAWARAELDTGNPAALVGPLSDLLKQHPLVESLAATLMRALHAAGRKTEALDCYLDLRRRLVEELGVEPGAELQHVHLAILRGDGDEPSAPRPAPAAVPAQLPLDVPGFTGRTREIADLDGVLGGVDQQVAAVVVSALSGTAGVGKTALAVHWAHRAADRFPDGQLYVNLRGYDPDQPMTTGEALTRFLTALGVPGSDIPFDLDERAARYRTETARRRMLIVLDNAATVEQVRPLLPGTTSCAALVTSRDSLAGLIAVHGAYRIDLDLLPRADAIALLRRLIGARAETEPDAVAALAQQCARLPLALRVAAELAGSRPASSLTDLVAELADQQQRLQLLNAGGDPRAAVTSVFSWSVRHLPPEAAHAFAVLGAHPGTDFDAYATAALADTSLRDARRAIDVLARAHLVHPTEQGRFGMHDLLRAYASSLATDGSQAAQGRLFDYYLGTAAAAVRVSYPGEAHHRPHVSSPATPTPALADPHHAHVWLDTERPNLVATAVHTAAHGWPTHAIRLSIVLYHYLDAGHYTDALTIHTHAHRAAEQVHDPTGQAHAVLGLGKTHRQLGRYEPAAEHLQQALALFQRTGDVAGQADTLNSIGTVEGLVGRHGPAAEHLGQALALFRRTNDQDGQARALGNLAIIERRLGHHETATHYCQGALALYQQTSNQDGQARVLNTLGMLDQQRGQHTTAADYLRQALVLYRERGNLAGEATSLDNLGNVLNHLGQTAEAAHHHQQALTMFRESGDPEGEAWALNGLGETAHTIGVPTDAFTHHDAALRIADQIGARDQQARAHAGLGHANRALGDLHAANAHYTSALTLYLRLGMPEAQAMRTHLASLVTDTAAR
jgi:DNA-binding SARP family transcriptional activator